MELKVCPKACEELEKKNKETGEITKIPPRFEPGGSVTVRLPLMTDVFRLKAKYGRRFREASAKGEGDDVDTFEALELLADIVEDVQKYFVSCDLVCAKTKTQIKTVEELMSFELGQEVLSELAFKFVFGFAEKN
jgi:hypothetical protein